MRPSSPHHFPVSPRFLLLLFVALVAVVVLVELNVVAYAFEKIGIRRQYIYAILALSLLGSAINIPLLKFPARNIEVDRVVDHVSHVVPRVGHRDRTILAVNVGGALIPLALSAYLLHYDRFFSQAAIGVAIVAFVAHLAAKPVPGVGIVMPILVAPVSAAAVALLLDPQRAAALAYVAGTAGTLLGADLLNIHRLRILGTPVASIGGAGISDGIFLTGIIAVLLA